MCVSNYTKRRMSKLVRNFYLFSSESMNAHLSNFFVGEIAVIDLEILESTFLLSYRAPHHDGQGGAHDLEQRNSCIKHNVRKV